jgi:hypothetical protein
MASDITTRLHMPREATATEATEVGMRDIDAHPVAALFPLLDEKSERFRALRDSMLRNGQLEPIVVDDDGRVLDGRNRLRVCALEGLEPKIVLFSKLNLGLNDCEQPVEADEYCFDKNYARRDLTDDQRVIIAARFTEYIKGAEEKRGAPKGNNNAKKTMGTKRSFLFSEPKQDKQKTRAKLAEKAGVSERKAQQALNVVRTDPKAAEEVARGEVALRDAAKRATKPSIPKPPDVEKLIDSVGSRIHECANRLRAGKERKHFVDAIIGIAKECA